MLKAPQSRQGRKMLFNPYQVRGKLDEPICGLDYYWSKDIEDSSQKSALSRTASFMLDEAVRCQLVGYGAASRELLEKAKLWYDRAEETKEGMEESSPSWMD